MSISRTNYNEAASPDRYGVKYPDTAGYHAIEISVDVAGDGTYEE